MKNYNLNQLMVLRKYFDDSNVFEFLELVNPSFSCYQLEILAKAFMMGIDISDLVNCHVSPDCLLVLCDAKMNGIDIKGLGNEFIDVQLLKQILELKKKNMSEDMSFICDLSLEDCKKLVDDYRLFGVDVFNKYREKANLDKKMVETELDYIINRGNVK